MRRIVASLTVLALAAVVVALAQGLSPARGSGRTITSRKTIASRNCSCGAVPGPTVAAGATQALGLGLLRHLDGDANVVFSPYSVETALAMADQGAAGSTAKALDRLLGYAPSPGKLARSQAGLRRAIARSIHAHGPALNDADAVWIDSARKLAAPFQRTLSSDFGAQAHPADFHSAPDAARQAINGWVDAQTNHLIPVLFGPGSIKPDTELVLANAIYLQARWQTPFKASDTRPRAFHTAPGHSVRTPFMSSGETAMSLPYATGRGWKAVALPYAHSTLQLLAVMPALGKLDTFQRGLAPGTLAPIAAALRTTQVRLSMPKLSLQLDTSLNAPLRALGAGVAFGPGADFSAMTAPAGALAISDVQHDAVLKVDEKGTTAAAATGVVIAPTAVPAPEGLSLSLDHPFLLLLRDRVSGAILFAARVSDPTRG